MGDECAAIVASVENIDARWIIKHLNWQVPEQAPVSSEALSSNGGDMGAVYRVHCAGASFIYKTLPDRATEWAHWSQRAGVLTREIEMYRWLEAQAVPGILAPRRLWSGPVDGRQRALALEDLGSGGLARPPEIARGLTYTQAQAVVRTFADLHALSATTYGRSQRPYTWLLHSGSECLIESVQLGLKELGGVEWPLSAGIAGIDAPTRADAIATVLAAAHVGSSLRAICHGDAWGSNVIFGVDGSSARLIDWQFAMWGNPLSDVAIFLLSSVQSSERTSWITSLLQVYHSALIRNGLVNYTLDACFADYQCAVPGAALVVLATTTSLCAGTGGRETDSVLERMAIVSSLVREE